MEKGQSGQLTATVYPTETVSQDVTWKSDNADVADVDNFGAITMGSKTGTATITVTSKEDTSKFATCTITVQPNVEVPSGWKTTTASDPLWYNYGATVNAPVLGDGMVPIVRTDEDGSTAKRWANAVTEDGSMWVWIPRYAYSIPSANYHTGTAGTVNIKFLSGTTNTPLDGSSITLKNESGGGNWNVHPAFIDMNDTTTYKQNNPTTNPLGAWNKEITGIWIAKFEASTEGRTPTSTGRGEYNKTDKTLQIKPGVKSWRGIYVGNAFTVCENYNSNLNSHLVKNSEWGALCYLSYSQYGINKKILGNDDGDDMKTGMTAYYTGGCKPYDDENFGGDASSSGNVYGVYDLAGGAKEWTASFSNSQYIRKKSGSYYTKGEAMHTSSKIHFRQNYGIPYNDEEYSGDSKEYASNIYGDAYYETSVYHLRGSSVNWECWDAKLNMIPGETTEYIIRDQICGVKAYSYDSIFAFDCNGGENDELVGFRPCLVAE